jgi:hypothetical protein
MNFSPGICSLITYQQHGEHGGVRGDEEQHGGPKKRVQTRQSLSWWSPRVLARQEACAVDMLEAERFVNEAAADEEANKAVLLAGSALN